jgi:hypothetical protein
MLVFGESILNDAVAIVLTNVIVESKRQFENIDTTKLTTYSVIGLLASSNFTTIPSVTNSLRQRNYNGLIENNGEGSLYEPKGDISPLFSKDDDQKYPLKNNEYEESNEPMISDDLFDNKNIPPKKKRRKSNFSIN